VRAATPHDSDCIAHQDGRDTQRDSREHNDRRLRRVGRADDGEQQPDSPGCEDEAENDGKRRTDHGGRDSDRSRARDRIPGGDHRARHADPARAYARALPRRTLGTIDLFASHRITRIVAAVAAASAAVTVIIAVVPGLHFAYRSGALHVALETTAALVLILSSALVAGRFRRSGRLDDLLLALALGLGALSNLAFATIPAAIADGHRSIATTWAAVAGSAITSLVFVVAAYAPARRLRRPTKAAVVAAIGAAGSLAIVGLVMHAFADRLPEGVRPSLSPGAALHSSHFAGNPAARAVLLFGLLAYAAASVRFARTADRTGDDLRAWLAIGTTLAVFARLNYLLYPSLYSDWVYVGDGFRLAFNLALLIGASREIGRYWRSASELAVLEERRRVARELHDGLAQELAFIARRISTLDPNDRTTTELAEATRRALAESRRAIAALSRPLHEPVDVVLAQATRETVARNGTPLELSLATGVRVEAAAREEIVRIACEAVNNAARHAHASLVRVHLSNGSRPRLTIEDDGIGFAEARHAPALTGGYGLISMRERAALLGAELTIASTPGEGTRVELILPAGV
jgi:signal transduction histidine kinase